MKLAENFFLSPNINFMTINLISESNFKQYRLFKGRTYMHPVVHLMLRLYATRAAVSLSRKKNKRVTFNEPVTKKSKTVKGKKTSKTTITVQ